MQREIKFRAICDADDKIQMLYFSTEQFDDGVKAWPMPDNISRIDNYESPLMQYTGLKDKNGKEIYEGDIIYNVNDFSCICGVGSFTDRMPWKRIVIWNENDLKFDLDFVDENMRGKGASGYTLCKKNAEKLFQVIGNIYENKNLLTDEDDKWKYYKEQSQQLLNK